MIQRGDRRPSRCGPSAGALFPARERTSARRASPRSPRGCASTTSVAPEIASRLSTSGTGSGFSASRSSRRCIFAMSLVRKQMLASPSPCVDQHRADAIGAVALAARRHQFQRHIVEREQHARRRRRRHSATTAHARTASGRRRSPASISPIRTTTWSSAGDHGNSPRVFLAARTFSTPIAIAAVRCGILSAFARATIWLEGAVEDLVFAPRHFLFLPEQLLQILHPFEIADHHAAGIAQDVRNQRKSRPGAFPAPGRHPAWSGRWRLRPAPGISDFPRPARRSPAPSPPAPARRRAASGSARDRNAAGWKSRRCCRARRHAASAPEYRGPLVIVQRAGMVGRPRSP